MKSPSHLKLKLPERITQDDYRNYKIVPVPDLPGAGTKRFQLLIDKKWLNFQLYLFLMCLLTIVRNEYSWLLQYEV